MIPLLLVGLGAGAGLGTLIGYWQKHSVKVGGLTLDPHRGAPYGALLGMLVTVLPATFLRSAPQTNRSEQTEPSNELPASKRTGPLNHDVLVHVDSVAEFEGYALQASKPCLADFYSDRCPPCRMLAPIIEDLAGRYEGRAVVCKVNLDSAPQLTRRYNIMGVPTVLFFEGGQEIHRLVGLRKQDDYTVILNMMTGKQ